MKQQINFEQINEFIKPILDSLLAVNIKDITIEKGNWANFITYIKVNDFEVNISYSNIDTTIKINYKDVLVEELEIFDTKNQQSISWLFNQMIINNQNDIKEQWNKLKNS